MRSNIVIFSATAGTVLAMVGFHTVAPVQAASPQTLFQDVSSAAGFNGSGTETWGANWTDYNNDLYPDIFVNNHRTRAKLYRNNRDGTFTDVSKTADGSKIPGWTGGRSDVDKHGSAVGDVDNDGDDDLILSVSSGQDRLLINNNGVFTDQSVQYGVDKIRDLGTRQQIFLDYNNDGLLDLATITLYPPAFHPRLPNGTFGVGSGVEVTMPCSQDAQWGHLTDLYAGGGLEFVCAPRQGTYPAVASFPSGIPTNVTASFQQYSPVNDGASLDFNGDLRPDLFLARQTERPSDAYQSSPTHFETQLITSSNTFKSVTFKTDGVVQFVTSTRAGSDPQGDPTQIDIGSVRWHPSSLNFQLDKHDSRNSGISSGARGVNIGYLTDTDTWKIQAGNSSSDYAYTYLQVTSTAPITGLTFTGASSADKGLVPVVLSNTINGLVNVTTSAGFNMSLRCPTVVAGDFDNDMDEDIFLGCTGGAQNLPNRLFLNDGAGHFTEVPNAGGAAGRTGAAVSDNAGTTEAVIVADYDLDGFLDLFVTNGLNMRPIYIGGPKQLFHNVGNGNHWLEFDLVGQHSNRDGIGSKVYVTAGGKTQYREANGGYHRWAQNSRRIHVGLAANTQADVSVEWPDGTTTLYTGLAADHLYRLGQGGGATSVH